MTIYQRPDEHIFASQAKAGEVTAFPNIPRGWGLTFEQTSGIPPMEWFNNLFQRIDQYKLYNLQRGLPEWSATLEYPAGSYVQYNNKTYRSLRQHTNQKPNVPSSSYWERWGFNLSEIGRATLTTFGLTQLTNDTGLDSETLALTAKAGKALSQRIAQNQQAIAGLNSGKVDKTAISNAVNSTSQTNVASSQAVKTAYDKAVDANTNANGRVSKSGDTMTGDLTARNLKATSGITSGYRVLVERNDPTYAPYINIFNKAVDLNNLSGIKDFAYLNFIARRGESEKTKTRIVGRINPDKSSQLYLMASGADDVLKQNMVLFGKSGNVAIGKERDDGERLQVEGDIASTKPINIKHNGWEKVRATHADGSYWRWETHPDGGSTDNSSRFNFVLTTARHETKYVSFPNVAGDGETVAYQRWVNNALNGKVNKAGDTMKGTLSVPNLTLTQNKLRFGDDFLFKNNSRNALHGFHFMEDTGEPNNNSRGNAKLFAQKWEATHLGHGAYANQYHSQAPFMVEEIGSVSRDTYHPFIKGKVRRNNEWGAAFSFGYTTNHRQGQDGFGRGVIQLIEDNGKNVIWLFEHDGTMIGGDFSAAGKQLSQAVMNSDITYQKIGNFEIHRFPNGTMIQTYVIYQNDLFDWREKSFSWAQAFTETPQIFTQITTSENSSHDCGINILTKSDRASCYYYEYEHSHPNQGQCRIQFQAIGRWK